MHLELIQSSEYSCSINGQRDYDMPTENQVSRIKKGVTLASNEGLGTWCCLKSSYCVSWKKSFYFHDHSILGKDDIGPNKSTCPMMDVMFISGSHSLTKTLDSGLRARVSRCEWRVTGPPSQHCDASPHQGLPATRREQGGDIQHPTCYRWAHKNPYTGRWQPIVLCPHTTYRADSSQFDFLSVEDINTEM